MISLLDLPGPMSQAKELWSKENPTAVNSGKVQFVEADFFKPIPVKENDIYYVRSWDTSKSLSDSSCTARYACDYLTCSGF
jgi:hypothetical protein